MDHAALHLAFHIAGVNGFAGVLNNGVVQDGHLAGLRVDFQVDHVGAKRTASALGINSGLAGDATTATGQLTGQLLEREFQVAVRLVLENTVFHLNIVCGHVPDRGGAFNHLFLDVLGGFVCSPTGGKRGAAAAGHGGVAN